MINDEEDIEIFDVFDIRKKIIRLNHFCIICERKIDYRSNICHNCRLKIRWDRPTPKMIEQVRRAAEIAHSIPRSEKQLEQFKKIEELGRKAAHEVFLQKVVSVAWKKPRTQKQIDTSRRNGKNAIKNNKNFISSWENRFYSEFLALLYPQKIIEQQYFIKEINHYFDFAIPYFRILIEIDGKYWHQFHQKRDNEIDDFAQNNNWILIRFDDDDLKRMNII